MVHLAVDVAGMDLDKEPDASPTAQAQPPNGASSESGGTQDRVPELGSEGKLTDAGILQ
jgi:hypothetical protein